MIAFGIALSSLTYQFVKLVKNALRQAGIPSDIKIGPHHMRKLAASYSRSYLGGTAEWAELFQRRMGSSSLSVLEGVYINEVPPVELTCVVPLGTLFGP